MFSGSLIAACGSVAIISNGNTVKNTEYSFPANVLAARGYMVASIQQDLSTDPPLMTKIGLPYVGRRAAYERGEANILFVLDQLKKLQPNADYGRLTLVACRAANRLLRRELRRLISLS